MTAVRPKREGPVKVERDEPIGAMRHMLRSSQWVQLLPCRRQRRTSPRCPFPIGTVRFFTNDSLTIRPIRTRGDSGKRWRPIS